MAVTKRKEAQVDFYLIDVTKNQRRILIAEDTLRARLQPHIDSLNKPRDIIGALALVVTFVTSFFSISGFDDSVSFFNGNISKEKLVTAMFIFTLASIFYLIRTIHNRRKHSPSLDHIVSDIKKEQNGI